MGELAPLPDLVTGNFCPPGYKYCEGNRGESSCISYYHYCCADGKGCVLDTSYCWNNGRCCPNGEICEDPDVYLAVGGDVLDGLDSGMYYVGL